MPSPKNTRKDATKKTPEKSETKEADLGQLPGQKRSQDFKSKIDGWKEAGAGIDASQDDIVVIEDPTAREGDDNALHTDNERKERPKAGNESKSRPITPKTPDAAKPAVIKQSSARKASREIDPDKKAWVRRRAKTQPEAPNDVKEDAPINEKAKTSPKPKTKASPAVAQNVSPTNKPEDPPTPKRTVTPKKRVVSDEHWRKERPDVRESKTPELEKVKDATPKTKIVRRSVASIGLKVPPSVHEFKDEPERAPVRVRPVRRKPRSRSSSRERDDEKAATPDYESSGVKVYIKRRRKSRPEGDDAKQDRKAFSTSESSFAAPSSVDRPASLTDITTPDATPTKRTFRSSTEPRIRRIRRSSLGRATEDRQDEVMVDYEDRPQRRKSKTPLQEEDERIRATRRVDSTDAEPEAFKIPAKKPPTPVPKVYENRIEGWLAGMPDDPFTEPSQSSLEPEALNVPRKVSRGVDQAHLDYEDDKPRPVARRRSSKTEVDAANPNNLLKRPTSGRTLVDNRSANPSQSLRRNGARRQTSLPIRDGNPSQPEIDRAEDDMAEKPSRRSSRRRLYGDLSERPSRGPGNRLSTIASMSTLHENHPNNPEESVLSRASDGDEPTRHSTVLRRRSMKHSDLISVLSLPKEEEPEKLVAPARSIRSRRSKRGGGSVGDLMNEISAEELQYQRELRTLVDGVVPVLLQYVLSQDSKPSSSQSKHGLRRGDSNLTQPIMDMGVVLERLKACHKRIPMHDPNELLLWAQDSVKIYSDYLHVWRLGFNDIVVNLAPAEQTNRDRSPAWDDGLQRNEHGDLLDNDGDRVDVAYLLKRPLVRIKSLSKTINSIDRIRPSALAEDMATAYEDLVVRARQRANDERARLEDEAAAGIDPSRARDLRNLVPLTGVHIDPNRCVRARDFFDLELFHSSGQQLDCKIEIIFRDNLPSREASSDILFCEISPAGRWLLFPPVLATNVSARKGDKDGEAMAMIRGVDASGSEWRELMSLRSDEAQCSEWLDMLGSDPAPPRLTRQSSFNTLKSPRVHFAFGSSSADSELPIGEQAKSTAPRWDGSEVNSLRDSPSENDRRHNELYEHDITPPPPPHRVGLSVPHVRSDTDTGRNPKSSEYYEHPDQSPWAGAKHSRSKSEWLPSAQAPSRNEDATEWPSPSNRRISEDAVAGDDDQPLRRPTVRRRTSSVPSMELPTVNKLRKALKQESPRRDTEQQRDAPTPARRLP